MLTILLILLIAKISTYAQPESFYHEFPFVFNDSVSMFFQQNTIQISDTTFFTGGNYGFPFSNAGMVISDTSGAVLVAKYINSEKSFHPSDIVLLDNNKIIYCGSFDLYDEITGSFKDAAAGLLCVDFDGNVLWEKYYGLIMPEGYPYSSNYEESFTNVIVDDIHQRLFCVGYSCSYNAEHEEKPYVVCTDYNGDTLWTWVMPDFDTQEFGDISDIVLTDNMDIICVGQITIHENKGYMGKNLIVKLSSEGEMVWSKFWGITNVLSVGVINVGNNEFVVAGEECECDTCYLTYGTIYKFNGDGDSIKKQTYFKNQKLVIAREMISIDGGFAVIGEVCNSFYIDTLRIFIAKYDNDLNLVSMKVYGDENSAYYYYVGGTSITFDKSIIITGMETNSNFNYIIKSDSLLNIPLPEVDLFIPVSQRLREILYYPNPVHDQLIIESPDQIEIGTISIYDMYGRIQYETDCKNTITSINLQNLTRGIYILRVNGITTGKLFIE